MTVFRDFEVEIIKALTRGVIASDVLDRVIANAEQVDFYYTGCGYFLTVSHPEIPFERIVCDKPFTTGIAKGIDSSFVVFLENHELTLECASDTHNVFGSYRELDLKITTY